MAARRRLVGWEPARRTQSPVLSAGHLALAGHQGDTDTRGRTTQRVTGRFLRDDNARFISVIVISRAGTPALTDHLTGVGHGHVYSLAGREVAVATRRKHRSRIVLIIARNVRCKLATAAYGQGAGRQHMSIYLHFGCFNWTVRVKSCEETLAKFANAPIQHLLWRRPR